MRVCLQFGAGFQRPRSGTGHASTRGPARWWRLRRAGQCSFPRAVSVSVVEPAWRYQVAEPGSGAAFPDFLAASRADGSATSAHGKPARSRPKGPILLQVRQVASDREIGPARCLAPGVVEWKASSEITEHDNLGAPECNVDSLETFPVLENLQLLTRPSRFFVSLLGVRIVVLWRHQKKIVGVTYEVVNGRAPPQHVPG